MNRKTVWIVSLGGVCCALGCDVGSQVNYTLRVTDSETGAPIVGACVSARGIHNPDFLMWERGLTDDDGRITVVDIQVVSAIAPVFAALIVEVSSVGERGAVEISGEVGATAGGGEVGATTGGGEFDVEVLSIELGSGTSDAVFGRRCAP